MLAAMIHSHLAAARTVAHGWPFQFFDRAVQRPGVIVAIPALSACAVIMSGYDFR
jgi:hypothetical protein